MYSLNGSSFALRPHGSKVGMMDGAIDRDGLELRATDGFSDGVGGNVAHLPNVSDSILD